MAGTPSMPRAALDGQIIRVMKRLDRAHERVYPWMVQPWLDVYRHERTLRKDMCRLAENGYLERVGQRKGYKLAEAVKFGRVPVQLRLPMNRAA